MLVGSGPVGPGKIVKFTGLLGGAMGVVTMTLRAPVGAVDVIFNEVVRLVVPLTTTSPNSTPSPVTVTCVAPGTKLVPVSVRGT